jgi:hypothetical protein
VSNIGKNPGQRQFTIREWELIDEITITMGDIVGQHSRREIESPKKLYRAYLELTSNRKKVDRISLVLNLMDMSGKEMLFHEQIQKRLTEISKGFSKYFTEELTSNPSRLSKILKEFDKKRIFLSKEGKKNIKRHSPKSYPRKSKGGEGRREGYPKAYGPESTIEGYTKILSNPKALDVINKRLVKHGALKMYYDLLTKSALELFRNMDERFFDFLLLFKILIPNLDPAKIPDPKLAKEAINSAREQELEQGRKEVVQRLLQNPNASVFFVFSLTKFEDNN